MNNQDSEGKKDSRKRKITTAGMEEERTVEEHQAEVDAQELLLDKERRKGSKILTIEPIYKGKFEIKDSQGRRIAEGFERPGIKCYVHARINGPNKGGIVDAFGDEFETLKEAEEAVREFYKKHGFSFEE